MRPLVLALNPSVDVEWRVDQVRREEKNDVLSERRWPGGKGVNVARWLKHLGGSPQLLTPLGGSTGKGMSSGLRLEKIPLHIIPLHAPWKSSWMTAAWRSTTTSWKTPFAPTAIGKKDWLFIGDAGAGERSAIIYTVIESCRRRGIDPYTYLRDVLTRLPNMTNRQVPEVTPDAWAKARRVKAQSIGS